MQLLSVTRKDRAFLGGGRIADRDDIAKELTLFEHIEDSLGSFVRDIDTYLRHRVDDERIQVPGSRPALWAAKKLPQV